MPLLLIRTHIGCNIIRIDDDNLATKRDLKELEMRLSIRLGAIMAGGIVIVATLVKLL